MAQVIGTATLAGGWQLFRIALSEKLWVAEPSQVGLLPLLEFMDSTAVGEADLLTNGASVVVARVAYLRPLGGATLPYTATTTTFEAQQHVSEIFCLRPAAWLPQGLLTSVPTLPGAPAAAELGRCTTL